MECVACSTSFLDPLTPPVTQTCACTSRVCIECRLSVNKCPFCRETTLGRVADLSYIEEVTKMRRSIKCEGCSKTVSTRLAKEHFGTCPDYLRQRIMEGRVDRMNLSTAYRDMCSVNQGLRARNFQLEEQVQMIFNSFQPMPPPPPPGLPPAHAPAPPPADAMRLPPVRIVVSEQRGVQQMNLLHP